MNTISSNKVNNSVDRLKCWLHEGERNTMKGWMDTSQPIYVNNSADQLNCWLDENEWNTMKEWMNTSHLIQVNNSADQLNCWPEENELYFVHCHLVFHSFSSSQLPSPSAELLTSSANPGFSLIFEFHSFPPGQPFSRSAGLLANKSTIQPESTIQPRRNCWPTSQPSSRLQTWTLPGPTTTWIYVSSRVICLNSSVSFMCMIDALSSKVLAVFGI